ncbi:GNAT family N-acetyltransferase [Streptomyces hiroshimensis]|uniref:N-acetyltransferase n=1 Tax=Streptomyces hiroshimensis TaxID=66424 RepID=A0ABQ2Y7A1_9ACTN|nr:GNAT family N-acetyltransferase [Streptomyces hiroshimensis]GGX71903.1 N-acetyltransferase [Streptomyces hiroshimensis]
MIIRRATAADAGRLTELVRGSGAYRGGYAAMVEDYEVTAEYIAAHDVFAAEGDDGTLLGFYALLLGPPAELDLMFVADAAQGRGVGRRLAAHMKDRARSAGLSRVRVVSHPPSEGFYRSVGAVRVGTVPATLPGVTWERPELVFALG